MMPTPFWSMLLWLTLSIRCNAQVVAELVYQYPPPTWVENLAVRPNGWIIPVRASSPILTQLNPATGEIQALHDWSAVASSIMGITVVKPDVFMASTMYCDLLALQCTPGSGITWLVDLRQPGPPRVTQLAKGPDPASVLNGMAALNHRLVLMVDQALGGIWGVDVIHGGAKLLFTDPSMMDPTGMNGGVNGVRVFGDTLYFNNPSIGTFAKVPINPACGSKVGNVTVITTGLEPDDFEIDPQEQFAYLTNGPENTLLKIDLSTGSYMNYTYGLAGPTTFRWVSPAERGKAGYVSTVGGYDGWLSGNVTVGGAIYRVEV